MRKFFRGICGVLATLLTLCILLMAAGLMGVRAFGITPYVVPADMEGLPWSAGALLYVRQEQPETLQPGDTIAYVTDSDLSLEGASSVPWTQSGASSMWREPRSTGTMCWGSPCGASMGWAMCPAISAGRRDCIWCWGLLWCWRCCASSPATPKGKENGRIPHREMYGNECGREISHRIGAGCGDGGGSPHLDGKACVCGGI